MTVNTTYLSWYSYMKDLAVRNKLIQHSDGPTGSGKDTRKFFHSTIENFITQTVNNLPPVGNGPLLWFIKPIRTIEANANRTKQQDTFQIMLFVLETIKNNDPDNEVAAQNRCDVATNQLLSRFKADSAANHTIWSRSMDLLDNIRVIPYEINGTIRAVGNQISLRSPQFFDYCFDQNDWL